MEYITTVHVSPACDERAEEFNNWYAYVHIRDVLNMPGHISAQRFTLSKYQPKDADLRYKTYTFYELRSKQTSTKSHQERVMSWEMYVSSAMGFRDYKESYWDHVYGNYPYASYASHGREQNLLVALIAPKGGADAETVFTPEQIDKIGDMPGVYAANLYRFGTEQMPKQTAAPEPNTHQLVIQLEDARDGCASWSEFVENLPGAESVEISIACYTSMMPRLTEAWPTPQDRSLAAISHFITALPGFYAGTPDTRRTEVLIPAIKIALDKCFDSNR